MVVQPGERYALVSDANDDWWYVTKDGNWEDGFYLPRTYVRVINTSSPANSTFRPRNSGIDQTVGSLLKHVCITDKL